MTFDNYHSCSVGGWATHPKIWTSIGISILRLDGTLEHYYERKKYVQLQAKLKWGDSVITHTVLIDPILTLQRSLPNSPDISCWSAFQLILFPSKNKQTKHVRSRSLENMVLYPSIPIYNHFNGYKNGRSLRSTWASRLVIHKAWQSHSDQQDHEHLRGVRPVGLSFSH